MKLGRTVLLGALGLGSGCFEDPTSVDPDTSGGSDTGSTTAPASITDADASGSTGAETTAGDDTTVGPTTGSTGLDETTGELPLECVDGVLEPGLGAGLVEVMTAPAGDDFAGSCGGMSSPDVAYQWEVPFDGFFVLDTQGSDFDTLLYLRDDCDGNELACSDNVEGTVSSRIVAPFEMGDRVVVVIDGNAGETGTAVLNIDQVDCPSAELTGQALPASFSNVAGTNEHGGACGGMGNPERAFRWQAPADGLYAFTVDSTEFQPAIYVEQGPICGGPELACNPPALGHAEVMRVLSAGEYVTVYADSTGGAGDFDIDITDLGATCPELPLGPGSVAADIGDFSNVMSSSCAPSGWRDGGMFYPYADATLAFMSPGMVGSNSGCEIVASAAFPVAVSLQQGACDGPEVQCEVGDFDMATGRFTASVEVGHIPPTAFTVTVSPMTEPWMWGGSDFTVEVFCFAVA